MVKEDMSCTLLISVLAKAIHVSRGAVARRSRTPDFMPMSLPRVPFVTSGQSLIQAVPSTRLKPPVIRSLTLVVCPRKNRSPPRPRNPQTQIAQRHPPSFPHLPRAKTQAQTSTAQPPVSASDVHRPSHYSSGSDGGV